MPTQAKQKEDVIKTQPPIPPRTHKTFPKWIVLPIILFIAIGMYLFFILEKNTSSPSVSNIQQALAKPSPTPFPFQEITIPYLRNKTFSSTIESRELAYENPGYTAYLASYRSDGLKINGLLTIPTGEKPKDGWPAIIFIHGYIPPAQYQTQGQYADYIDYFARNGFVVYKIDLRGHAQSEGEAGGGYYGADYVIDTLNAYSALQASDFVDSKKIGLWGHSMAGNVVMRSFAVKPTIPAVVIWAGAVYSYTDQVKYGINDSSFQPFPNNQQRLNRRQRIRDLYGEPRQDNIFWQQMAPTNYLNDLKGAIQIDHAVDDTVVNIGYSRDLNALLDKTSVSHELHEYPSGGHNITGQSFVDAMENSVAFFKKHL